MTQTTAINPLWQGLPLRVFLSWGVPSEWRVIVRLREGSSQGQQGADTEEAQPGISCCSLWNHCPGSCLAVSRTFKACAGPSGTGWPPDGTPQGLWPPLNTWWQGLGVFYPRAAPPPPPPTSDAAVLPRQVPFPEK